MANLTNTLTESLTTIQTEVMAAFLAVIPIALAIFAAPYVIRKGLDFFRAVTSSSRGK